MNRSCYTIQMHLGEICSQPTFLQDDSTTSCADLELGLYRADASHYRVDFRFSQPESDADIRCQAQTAFDLPMLAALRLLPDEYGLELTRSLFQEDALRTAFAQARTSAQEHQLPLRLRFLIGPNAPELHDLCWELLRNPQDGSPLATDTNILFSRYLSSLDWHPVRLKPRGELKALAAVAASSDLEKYQLAEIDRVGEFEQAISGMGELGIGQDSLQILKQTTLSNLVSEIRIFSPDVLYLVCHGILTGEQPVLVLEDENGLAEKVPGKEFILRLKELETRPKLVVLASCQSGNGLSALGPHLAEIGIPTVLAMQDNLSMETAARFIPEFFKELSRDGQIDRAVSVARSAVRERPDAWVPVLITRLKSGRLWCGNKSFERHPAPCQASIKEHRSLARG